MKTRRKRNRLASSSKANVSLEIIIIVVILFTFAITSIFVYDFFIDIMGDITTDEDISASATAPTERLQANYPKIFDTGMLLILIALWIGTIVLAFQIDTYPVFFGITLLALIVVLIVPPILANTFEETFQDDTTSGLTDSFPMMFWIMTHLLDICIFIGGSVAVALYAKSKI